MKKTMLALMMALMALMSASSLADGYYLDRSSLPEDSQQKAEAAFAASRPGALINYTILDRDDGRFEWEIFFSENGEIGMCEVDAHTGVILRTKTYSAAASTVLTADAAIEELGRKKGNVTVLDLELDRDDGRLIYEGEAELDGRFYDFEMTVGGEIIEWERD